MHNFTEQDSRLQSASRWCQWMAVIVLIFGVVGALAFYFLADRKSQWVGLVVAAMYTIPSIALMALGEFIRQKKRWAITTALILYCGFEAMFILNVIATVRQQPRAGP